MNFLFRVDAGGQTGLGHYYRSLSLAKLLAEKGHQVNFVHDSSPFWDDVKKASFPYRTFEINLEKGINELEIIRKYNIDIFYVDGIIDFKEGYIKKIKNHARVVFYQNLSNTRYLADVFILPSIHQNEHFFESFDDRTQVYQGLEYFTFNASISELEEKKIDRHVKNIGIITGGSDPKNTLKSIFYLLDFEKFKEQDFFFYYGKDYMHKNNLPSADRSNIHFQLFDHQKVIKSDILVSAFGVTTCEFLSKGMPIIAFGHQESNAHAATVLAAKTKSLISLGFIDNFKADFLNNKLEELVINYTLRKNLSTTAKAVHDLEGVNRVAEILEGIHEL